LKGFFKLVAVGVVVLVIGVVGVVALIGAGASSVSHAVSKAEKSDTANARAFQPKFAKIKVGNALSGKGGMTFAEVKALVGKPQPKNISTTESAGYKLTTWSYDFFLSNGKSIYSVEFSNGRVSGKTTM
jgi:hypothetical protein